jgi:hypothetical protein
MATGDPADQPDPPTAFIRLHLGTDLASAQDILTGGLNANRAAAFNVSGEFWVSTDPLAADTFAQVNPSAGIPARFDFDLPVVVLHALLNASPPRAYQQGPTDSEFLPSSFPQVNRHMTNQQVVSPVP